MTTTRALEDVTIVGSGHRLHPRSRFMIDPASGTLVVNPKFDLEIEKAMRRRFHRIKFRVYRELLTLHLAKFVLECRYLALSTLSELLRVFQ